MKLTWLLVKISCPEIFFAILDGVLITFFFASDHPEYCKVAPKMESSNDPNSPENAPKKILANCEGASIIDFVQNKIPKETKIKEDIREMER